MRNPRPCECGLTHRMVIAFHPYRPAKRTEPLRADRRKTRVTLRPSSEPSQAWTTSDVLRIEFAQLAERQLWDGEHYIAVSALREFLEAELAKVNANPQSPNYWWGCTDALERALERFCG